jgi:pimeloyl-ACP methyl ester carboxylesterase
MSDSFQLVLLPGLGADDRLLEPQRNEFPQLVVPDWISPRKNESLPEYAVRMADTVPLSAGTPLILGGVSFGGMLACEMAQYLRPAAVVLIASCHTRRGLRPVYRAGRWLLPLVPIRTWDLAKALAAPAVRLRIGVPSAQRELAVAMFKNMDSRFMHWVLQAILRWEPKPLEGIRVFHIHGRRDLLIPLRRVDADEVIRDGGHLINITHASQVNAFISKVAMISQQT